MSTKTPVTQQVIRDFLNSGIEYLICEGEESALVVVSAFVACPMGYMRLVEPGQRLLRLSSPSQYSTAWVNPLSAPTTEDVARTPPPWKLKRGQYVISAEQIAYMLEKVELAKTLSLEGKLELAQCPLRLIESQLKHIAQ